MAVRLHPDIPDQDAVEEAFRRLSPDATPRWGRMTAPEMLEHCARLNDIYLGRIRVSLLVRLAARLLGGVFIRKALATSPLEMQRGMRTLPALRIAQGSVDPVSFEAIRERLLSGFREIEARSGTWDHPLYGRLDAEVVRAMVRHHAAHHLAQFGVLADA